MTEFEKERVRYRIRSAFEALNEAQTLARNGHWRGAVNRLFYACFYAASALLLAEGFDSSKHSGVQSLFHEKLVNAGRFPKETAQIYNRLFSRRNEVDYRDFVDATESTVAPYMPRVIEFVQTAASILRETHGIEVKESN